MICLRFTASPLCLPLMSTSQDRTPGWQRRVRRRFGRSSSSVGRDTNVADRLRAWLWGGMLDDLRGCTYVAACSRVRQRGDHCPYPPRWYRRESSRWAGCQQQPGFDQGNV